MTPQVALVTAAGSGMGAAIARTLAGHGYKVGILSSSGRGEALAAELGGVGVTGSNQDPAALERLVDRAVETFGGIDAVVNSAGYFAQLRQWPPVVMFGVILALDVVAVLLVV